MKDQNNIQDEWRSLNSSLPGPNNQQTPFSVPEGYFDGLAASVLAKVKAQELSPAAELQELSPLLAGISREMPYTLPAGYFDRNLEVLPFLTSEPELAVLAAAGKTVPYAVPQGYFENLSSQVLQKVAAPEAKLIPLFARKWMRVAVAAVVGGAMLIGGYRLLNTPDAEELTAQNQVQADTTGKLLAQNKRPSVVQDIKKASTEELDAFIKSVPLNTGKSAEAPEEGTARSDVKELLKNVSVTEINNFLEQLPTADEDLALID